PWRPAFESCEHSPQQDNGHDCGVYVMAVAARLCGWQAAAPAQLLGRLPELPKLVTPAAVHALRGEALLLVRELAAREEKGL
ncbi:hypothetical protein MNEG_15020, partial [Monoraphidium neglectum]